MMRRVLAATLLALAAAPAQAQIPPEWESAAKVVIDELERDMPVAARPWASERREGWSMARAWRRHNNGNSEIILAEYLTFTLLCRESGCADLSIEGKGYVERAAEVRALIAREGGSYGLVRAAHDWLAGLDDASGAAAKNAAMWSKDPDVAAADFATGNIYALDWVLARLRRSPAEQATSFARLALFVQGKAWIGRRCLDITKVATVIGAPPAVEACR
jgi:hypothetical protein